MSIERNRNFYSINTTFYLRNANINKKEIRRERERLKVLFIQKHCSQLRREREIKKEKKRQRERERERNDAP